MWFRKASARRQAIREDVAEVESLLPALKRDHGHMAVIAAVFFLVASAVQFWPSRVASHVEGERASVQFWPSRLTPYREGQRAAADIRSPVAFRMVDEQKTEELRELTREATPPVVVATPLGVDHIVSQLIALKQDVQNVRNTNEVPPEVRARFPALSETALRQIQSVDSGGYATMVRTFVSAHLRGLPFVTRKDYNALMAFRPGREPTHIAITSTRGLVSENLLERPIRQLMVVGEVSPQQRAMIKSQASENMGVAMADVVASYLANGLREPTHTFDQKLSTELADMRASLVLPGGKPILENQVIVQAGETITPEMMRTLEQAQNALEEQASQRNPWAWLLSALGRVLTVLLLTAAGVLYVLRVNAGAEAKTPGQAWAVCGLLLAMLVVARAVVGAFPQSAYLSGIAPTLFAAIILVVAYNQRFGIAMAGLHGLLVTITLGLGIDFYLALLTGAAVFCFGLREIRTRGKLIEMGFFAGVAIFAAVWALGLGRMIGSVWNPWMVATDLRVVAIESMWGAGAGLVVSMVMSAVLPPVERIFKITTAMTLLELCDANKPLLRRLQQEAPGTFNHSLTVGIMAEAAGNAIGANGLLCRVGAYYHDIGKLSKPAYFIENQTGGAPNRHEKLSPAMSLLIIVGHVKDGIELAREYALPWIVHQFIAQHHGTTLVEYFFHAAKKRKEQDGDHIEVSETEFRYPGPKPQTREAAIVMICDGCESVVRSIEEPTPGRIEAAVHTMIMKRLMDGQFNECDLTLKQLSLIEERLIRTLAGIHHGRVAYPASSSAAPDVPQPMSRPA
jgi:putative nucleotidyltransferase with HDIG domain